MRKTEVWSLTLQAQEKKHTETVRFTDCQNAAVSSRRAWEEECEGSDPAHEGSIVIT